MSTTVTQTIQFSKETLLKSVPAEAFQKHDSAALRVIARVVVSVVLSYAFLIWAPAYLVPVAWIVVGTALSGLITIAHDCGHNAFFESNSKNQLAGTLAFLPLLYPLESWKLHHNAHHKHAEERSNAGHQQKPKKLLNPLLWPLYVGSYLLRYFDLSQFSKEQQARSRTSVLSVYGYALVFFSSLFYFAGAWGIVKYWAMPWLVVHFWKNTLRTYLMGVIDWKNQQLFHYKYPAWVEFLCYDANYLIPHYLSTQIPTYNCRAVHEKLRASEWGQYIVVRSWLKLLEDQDKDKSSKGQKVREPKKFKLIPFIRTLNWLHIPLLVGLPIAGFYGLFTLPFYHPYTLAFAFAYYLFSGLGITAGYHRLWAHRAYEAALPFRLFLMLGGTAAVEGSIRWWCRDHRAHHRYTDTTKDPYSAKEGFWYAHIGWMLVKQNPKNIGFADISDLNADPMIRWQHRHYLPFAFFMSFGLPALICGLGWGDFWGGFYLAGILRLVFVHHATFFVNSLAHTMGSHTYSDKHTPRDSIVTALLTFGEGYHNFHHEFPNDYRNGIKFYHYDPTKWLIRGMAFFGMAYDLKEFPDNEIQKGVAQMVQKKVDTIRAKLQWGPEVSSLPLWSEEDLQKAQENGKKVVIIDGVVHDVTVFVNNHPGGNIIKSYLGADATAAFYGGVYDHSNAAINLLATLRLARYSGPLAIPSSPATEKKEH